MNDIKPNKDLSLSVDLSDLAPKIAMPKQKSIPMEIERGEKVRIKPKIAASQQHNLADSFQELTMVDPGNNFGRGRTNETNNILISYMA